MEGKREDTKLLLAESFYQLMLSHDFDKITIRMITDSANVIRPTFYYYFQDKYDLLEWILTKSIFDNVNRLLDMNQEKEALKSAFVSIGRNRKFFASAFKIVGQNSFEEMLSKHSQELFSKQLSKYKLHIHPDIKLLKDDLIARYYTIGIVNIIKNWITDPLGEEASAEEIFNAYNFMISHSIFDIIEE